MGRPQHISQPLLSLSEALSNASLYQSVDSVTLTQQRRLITQSWVRAPYEALFWLLGGLRMLFWTSEGRLMVEQEEGECAESQFSQKILLPFLRQRRYLPTLRAKSRSPEDGRAPGKQTKGYSCSHAESNSGQLGRGSEGRTTTNGDNHLHYTSFESGYLTAGRGGPYLAPERGGFRL